MIYKALCDPERFANAGSFSPLEVITEQGTVYHAGPTAPQGYYFETRIRLFDMLWQCMARALPGRLPAGSFSSIFGTVIAGQHPDTGRRYTMVEPQMGGWGATCARDGMNAMFSNSHGDTFNTPVEICKARYELGVAHKSLADRPAQDAICLAGRGVSVLYETRAEASLSVGYTRGVVPVWSLDQVPQGGKNAMHILRGSGEIEYHRFISGARLKPGDRVLIETAFGGNA